MSHQISTFNFKSHQVRIETINNEPYFALKDVCLALAIQVASPERFNLDPQGVTLNVIPTIKGNQELTFINEPNLYRIIFKSRKAEAVEFQNWVFEEVLPQIRKTGQYSVKPIEQEPTFTHSLTSEELRDLAWLWFGASKMAETMNAIYQPLSSIGSNLAPMVYSQGVEYGNHIQQVGKLIYRLTCGVDFSRNPTPFHHLQGIATQLPQLVK